MLEEHLTKPLQLKSPYYSSMKSHSSHNYNKNRRQTLPALSLGYTSLWEQQSAVTVSSSSHSSVVSLLECGSLANITTTPRCQIKFHTLDEMATNREDAEDAIENDETFNEVNKRAEPAVTQANERTDERLSLSERLDKLTLGQDLAQTILHKRSRSWGKSPTRIFIKNFP